MLLKFNLLFHEPPIERPLPFELKDEQQVSPGSTANWSTEDSRGRINYKVHLGDGGK
jgi:hypothetical protein